MDNTLINEIKLFVIETLNLEDITVDDIDTESPLFNEGLGLDSIDALELGVGLQKRYGIKLQSDSAENRQHFASIRSLAEFVSAQRQ
ncbi:acyl carrier protein [Chitinibacter fontanus]|uniref:Acyl carrier protein n=1 Tax=Chitinibacter fontanus TaxID=1737446 RepID=A0A7D5ZH59_9NEIS|nr:phosphopantetheine-binding protein [Chitinibacter fontanus]QLI82308.1 acyl carrier protein [Chitinibacter fontanus]